MSLQNNKKKLSILIYSLAGGGAERVVSILLNELEYKFDITLVLMNHTVNYRIPDNQKIIYLENSNVYESGIKKLMKLPYLAWKYKEICQKNDIKASLSFMNRPNYINIFACFFGNKVKAIISERAMPSLQHKIGLQGSINRFLIRSLYSKANVIIANSKGNRLDLIENFFVSSNKIKTIYNPIDLEHIKQLSQENVEFDLLKFTFITIGRLDIGKNHKEIIEAFSKLNDMDIQLIIIGEGKLKEELQNQIDRLKLNKQIFLVGYQKNPFKWLAKSNCFVFSSSYEGFPNVLLEALACGLPVISTDCPSGPREILAPATDITNKLQNNMELAKYGILTPVQNVATLSKAMKKIIQNEELQKKLKYYSKHRVQSFEKEKIIKEYEKVIYRWIN